MINTPCPRCRSKIAILATRCPRCHTDLTPDEIASNRLAVRIMVGLAAVAGLVAILSVSRCGQG